MQTFTLDPRSWLVARIVGRNPLLRRSDRIEAFVVLVALVVSLLAVPLTGVVAAVVYDARHRLYDQEVHARHPVTATVTGVTAKLDRDVNQIAVHAKWSAVGGERNGILERGTPVKPGERIEVWVDNNGNVAPPPTPTWHAATDAVATVMATMLTVGLAITWLKTTVHSRLARVRDAQWEREIASFQEHDGRTNWH